MACTPDDCVDVTHYEFGTWPVRMPAPRACRRGDWPRPGTRADRIWAVLRSRGLIRLYHR